MRYNFRRLSDVSLILGVRSKYMLVEGIVASLLLFLLFKWWYIVLSLVIVLHIVLMLINRQGTNFKNEVLFLLTMEGRRVYKEGSVYLPIIKEE